ncbi:acetyl-CoA carboxylase, biotin carboxyl carrier protein [Cetobacterium sp. 8H]|uniref:acetyl-CoA carboxylase biotin carboxyl carrier protein n=1 Tax=Cetobacterium sp. 8H TaxID=2759681 RepID=UPI00163B81A0|nr:biotin/lipoyl-containing protein [Cetobacterium sp. 8H]MBC2850554.1 acetyl-CoA carboxylase, biotin carboxyl carrier protein [Cetobacterium sp. 8H]
MKLDLETIKKLAKSIEKHNLSEITVEINGTKLTMKKEELKQELANNIKYMEKQPTYIPKEEIVEELTNVEDIIEGKDIVSPMVGTFYSAPSPDSEDFVKIGDKIEVGDTICIVEAMKMMNEVKSTISGTIVAIKSENGKVIKKGETLFVVK